jgi:hypothetical protein
VIDGVYTLQDPTGHDDLSKVSKEERRPRQGSISSQTATSVDAMDTTIRMPPSLTLSKIRGVKQQALVAAVNANMEVSTVALACVYFERLCLDTRVDKSNRRLSLAACLLLAAKINEKNVRLDIKTLEDEEEGKFAAGLHSLVKPTKASSSMFASLLEFFAHDWSLSLKNVFAAEWGVFVVSHSVLLPPCFTLHILTSVSVVFSGTWILVAHDTVASSVSFQTNDEDVGMVSSILLGP